MPLLFRRAVFLCDTRVWRLCIHIWYEARGNSRNNSRLLEERALFISEGESRIRNEETDMASIERREKRLIEEADERYFRDTRRYAALYLEKTRFMNVSSSAASSEVMYSSTVTGVALPASGGVYKNA